MCVGVHCINLSSAQSPPTVFDADDVFDTDQQQGHVTVDESLLPPELRAAVREAIKAAAGGAVTRALDDKQHGHRPPLFAALPLTNVTNQPLSDVTERGRLYQRGRNVVADEFDDLSEADGDEADVDEMHDEVTRKQSESDAKTNAALDVIYRELQQISNELKVGACKCIISVNDWSHPHNAHNSQAKSIALREREARIATQELVLREQQAQLTSTISIATLAESDRARLAMRAEFEEVLKQRDEQARLVAKENRRVGESLKELTAGHRAMRERVVCLEVELAEKEKVVEELRGLFKTVVCGGVKRACVRAMCLPSLKPSLLYPPRQRNVMSDCELCSRRNVSQSSASWSRSRRYQCLHQFRGQQRKTVCRMRCPLLLMSHDSYLSFPRAKHGSKFRRCRSTKILQSRNLWPDK